MSLKSKILVTGASGFVGSHIVDQLLRGGYAVRAVSRSAKAEQLRKNCPDPNFEVTIVNDLVAGDFSEALQGITGIIHAASAMVGGQDSLEVTIGGTMNIIRQAYAASIYKIVVISSYITTVTDPRELSDGSHVITDKDWRKVTKEDINPDTPNWEVYAASKTLAEQAAWDFAESHPEIDLTTILPPFTYGPLAPAHVVSDPSDLSSNEWIYQLIARPTATYPPYISLHVVDVRDVATAAVRALSTPARDPGESHQGRRRRRVLLHSGSFTWTDAVKHLAHVRHELKDRLVEGGNPSVDQGDVTSVARIDITVAKEDLGMESLIDWHQTVEDAIDSMIQREVAWAT